MDWGNSETLGKWVFEAFCKVTDGSHFSPKTQETGLPYISVKDIGVNEIDLINCKRISKADFKILEKNGCRPNSGDILLTKDGTIGRAAVIKENSEPFVVLSSLGILTPNEKIHSQFLYFYLVSGTNIDQMFSFIHGSALTRLTIEKIEDLYITCPPIPEQIAIANFLDRKTAEIDELIADKKRLLELYEEEKTAIINELVTGKRVWDGKAWTEPVEVNDTVIECLPAEAGLENVSTGSARRIPEHWEVKTLKYVAQLKSGNNIVSEQIKDNLDYPVYGGNGTRGFFDDYTHDGNFVLIGRQGAYCGNIHYAQGKFWASEHAVVLTPKANYQFKYLGELLRSLNLGQYSVSAAQPGLAVELIKNL